MNFENIWSRIQCETEIRTFTELANLIGTTSQYISRKRKENDFLVIWAYAVGQKYKLSTDWIMTGKGFKRLEEQRGNSVNYPILCEIGEWLDEEVRKNPKQEIWFEVEFEKQFQEFKEWKRKRDQGEGSGNSFPSSKVA